MSFARTERQLLAQLLLNLGPDAPTLCEGWTTRDLATHLFIREHRPHAALGMFLGPARGLLERETTQQQQRPFDDIVRAWAAGPPMPLRVVDKQLNTAENFIHHEDVRRGDGVARPRGFSGVVDKQLLGAARMFGRLALRGVGIPVILTPPALPPVTLGEKHAVASRGDDVVRVFGEPGELLLWVSGRDAVDVRVEGRDDYVAKVSDALGI
ncbi:TIGR03085 family metal-binding protein [Corynebacterium sp.]|uniref:TIGR03085 family metal-binding protein n=1 Tax=Corynebacterium sp. TaxID=1720 RepID=UPI002A9189EB|nr:TIGR03085 family metal-binding protein [Corynebacterium sp.]MDY5785179.1 TIGR03085 family metal-binding protein [Corynebacterium sp.]